MSGPDVLMSTSVSLSLYWPAGCEVVPSLSISGGRRERSLVETVSARPSPKETRARWGEVTSDICTGTTGAWFFALTNFRRYAGASALSQGALLEGRMGERKWVERNGSNRPPVPWVESSPFRNWVEWTWVDLEKCQVLGRQHIDFDQIPFDPIRPQSIRPKLFDQKGRSNSFRPISFDPFHAIRHESAARRVWNRRSDHEGSLWLRYR